MNRRFLALAFSLAGLACGKQTFLAAAFVQTPSFPNPTDPSHPIPQMQVMTTYFGTIDTTDPTKIDASKIAAITDAAGVVSFRHLKNPAIAGDVDEDRILPVAKADNPAGTYLVNSKDEPRLTFENGVPYTLVLTTAGSNGEAFGARLTPGPPDDMKEFQGMKCSFQPPFGAPITTDRCLETRLGQAAMTITRTVAPAAGSERLPAFVLVARVDPQNPGKTPEVTFTTVPESADKLLKYVLSDHDYRWASFNIPETAFAQSGYHVVSLLTVRQGKVSSNAFLGSTALAATGAAGLVNVK